MFVLRNLARLMERPKALQDRIFDRLFEQAEIAKYTPEERREYAESIKNYWDYYSTMKTAHKKGIAEGLEEGLTKGRAEGEHNRAIETARKMKADGMTADIIAKYTGLTIEEIKVI
jgi:predicted transposase/invertase (TIGR01784 family)